MGLHMNLINYHLCTSSLIQMQFNLSNVNNLMLSNGKLKNYYFRIITDKETALFTGEARANSKENIFERFRGERNNVGCERSLRGSTSGRHHARCTARRPHEDLEHARCLVAFGRQMLGNSAVKY